MPTREYKCPKCGKQFERRFATFKADEEAKLDGIGDACPDCGAVADRQISLPSRPVFKGSGFYETDYRK